MAERWPDWEVLLTMGLKPDFWGVIEAWGFAVIRLTWPDWEVLLIH